MKQTERIDALEARIETLEKKLAPAATSKVHHRRTKVTYAEAETELKALTAEEEAFLKARSIDTQQRRITLNIHIQRMTEDEAERTKTLIDSIKQKRTTSINWY